MHSSIALTAFAASVSVAHGLASNDTAQLIPGLAIDAGWPVNSCGQHITHNCIEPMTCCSKYGWCGRGINYCGTGYQPGFGSCDGKWRCGEAWGSCTDGLCCSAELGLCGSGSDYCSVPDVCQRKFGRCDSDKSPTGVNTALDPRPLSGKAPYGTIINHCVVPGTLALTYDDGPSNFTPELLQILKNANAKATFFIGGNINGKGSIDENPELREMIHHIDAEGHMLGSHTWSHPNMDSISTEIRQNEMHKNEVAFVNILGKYPTFMRPPYVNCTDTSGCMGDMKALGYHVVGYQADSTDWSHENDLNAMKQAVNAAFGNSDSLLLIQHDTLPLSAINLTNHALMLAKERGWKAVTVAECLGTSLKEAYWSKEKGQEVHEQTSVKSMGTKNRPW